MQPELVVTRMNTTRTTWNLTEYESQMEYVSYEVEYNDSYYENYTDIGYDFDIYDEQSMSDIKLLLVNPMVSLGKMVTVSLINTTFKPYDYAFIIRTASQSACERVIRITNSRCKFNLMNFKWYIRLYIRSASTQDLKKDDVKIEKMDGSIDTSNITQLDTTCKDWSMSGDCSDTEVFQTYMVCRPITGQSIPLWSPEFIPHSEIFDCFLGCPANCSCTLRGGVLMSSCNDDPIYSTGIVWNAPGQEDYFGVRFEGNINRIGKNAFSSYSFSEGVVAFLLTSDDQSVRILETDCFSGFGNLSELYLNYNGIQVLKNGSFNFLRNLQLLELDWNDLEIIGVKAFSHLANLQVLSMRRNQINYLPFGTFSCLHSLVFLKLQYNQIQHLQPGLFKGMHRLEMLDLSNNQIHKLQSYTFRGLISLRLLYLKGNGLQTLSDSAFVREDVHFAEDNLHSLCDVDGNDILQLSGNCHVQNPTVTSSNVEQNIQNHSSSSICHLDLVKLTGNDLKDFSFDSFNGLTNSSLEVDHDWLCCFVKDSFCEVPTRERKTTNFLTCNRLLPNNIARILLCLFCAFALIGNIVVIIWQLNLNARKSVQPFLIANLAVSDFLMGMYMLIIASADMYYGDYFPAKTETWRNSYTCLLAGTLSMVSSELSMLLVTLISLDRLMGIRFTFSNLRLDVKRASFIVTLIWFVSLILGLIPVFAKSSLNYELSEVCVALPLSMKVVYTKEGGRGIRQGVIEYYYSVSQSGMYYSIAVFIGLNSLCCLFIAICYIWIFVTVKTTALHAGRHCAKREEVRMAMKMAVIVLTDFCCWVPVIIMGILVQTGIKEIPPVANAWIVTLVMPINSAINPFLYTLSTVLADRYHKTKAKWRLRHTFKHTSEIPLSSHETVTVPVSSY